MTPLPKKKHSRSRSNQRRNNAFKISLPSLVKCKNCGKLKYSHKICAACGAK